jgi:hypothetical protein
MPSTSYISTGVDRASERLTLWVLGIHSVYQLSRDAGIHLRKLILEPIVSAGGEYQTHDFYLTVGPIFSDPLARQLYAEIAAS